MNAKNKNINYSFYLFLLYLYLMCENLKIYYTIFKYYIICGIIDIEISCLSTLSKSFE